VAFANTKWLRSHASRAFFTNRKMVSTSLFIICMISNVIECILGTLQSALDPAERGTFCDSCFIHVHEKKRTSPHNQEASSKSKPLSSSGNAAITISVSDR